VHATGIRKKTPAILFIVEGLAIKIVYMCNNFTGPPGHGQCKLASTPAVLFYSDSNLLPACGVQSVQRREEDSTTKLCLKSSTE